MYDIGIIGGGTAGLTAAIYGQRAGKKTIVFEGTNFGGQIASSPEVENYPGIAKISGAELSMKLMEQAVNLGAETVMEQVTGVRDSNGMKAVSYTHLADAGNDLGENVIVDSVVELIRVDVVGMFQTRNADRVRSDAERRFQMFRVHQKSGKFVAVFVQSEQNAKSYVVDPALHSAVPVSYTHLICIISDF